MQSLGWECLPLLLTEASVGDYVVICTYLYNYEVFKSSLCGYLIVLCVHIRAAVLCITAYTEQMIVEWNLFII